LLIAYVARAFESDKHVMSHLVRRKSEFFGIFALTDSVK